MKRAADKFRRIGAMTCVMALAGGLIPLRANAEDRNLAIQTLKSDIAEAKNVQRIFADTLPHCASLDGNSFYNNAQKRVVLLSELETSVKNLVKDQVFNPQKKHPWTAGDAEELMKVGQLQAERDQRNCNLVAKLPEMNKKLNELEVRP
jgi:hypothetical protein